MVARKALSETHAAARPRGIEWRTRFGRSLAICRASSESRGVGVFRISLQAGGDTYSRRRRRMGNNLGQHRERQPARNYQGDALSAFARLALFGIHPLRGV